MNRAELRLSKLAFGPARILCNDTRHIPPFSMSTGIWFSFKNLSTVFAVRVS